MLRYGEEQTKEVEDYNEWDEYGEATEEDDVIEARGYGFKGQQWCRACLVAQ